MIREKQRAIDEYRQIHSDLDRQQDQLDGQEQRIMKHEFTITVTQLREFDTSQCIHTENPASLYLRHQFFIADSVENIVESIKFKP